MLNSSVRSSVRLQRFKLAFVACVLGLLGASIPVQRLASQPAAQAAEMTPAERGHYNLTHNAYGFPLLNKRLFESLPKVWEPEWQAKIDPNDPASFRKVAFARYGFSEPVTPNDFGAPLQLVVGKGTGLMANGWTMSCMLCHGGQVPVTGESKIGMPNTELDMQALYDDVLALMKMKAPFPLTFSQSRGRTNAFIFSLELVRRRNEDLSPRAEPLPMGTYRDYDLDAPAWWYLKKKTAIYADGSVSGDLTRALMQFTMGEPDGAKIRSWEGDFKDILAYLKTIEAPGYPFPVDAKLAKAGQAVFTKTCSGCHGTYEGKVSYPNKIVPLEVIGTDPVRLTDLTKEFRSYMQKSWFGQGSSHVEESPKGYVAPPLDGIWASAPYFHNGSVPTLYGVLTESARPRYFRRTGTVKDYDQKNLGLPVETLSAPAPATAAPEARRRVVNTTITGLSNAGHPFGFKLSEREKQQVLEYLKTL